jgi:pimeloyl-ACP methyl ester carboxylesterase
MLSSYVTCTDMHHMRVALAIVLVTVLCAACVSSVERVRRTAVREGLHPLEITGLQYRLAAFERIRTHDTRLVVMIEGDGSPWVRHGLEVAADPETRNPLVLRLMTRTPASVLYLGRPCYLGHARDAGCSPELWTSARYSRRVVESMAAAIDGYAQKKETQRILLLGHSGGGTLAVLIARHLQIKPEVVTIAANLDIDSWARVHGYTALEESLNPADEAPLPRDIRQLHFAGARDRDVPIGSVERYTQRLDPAQMRVVPGFDHVCCWEEQWPRFWAEIEHWIEQEP